MIASPSSKAPPKPDQPSPGEARCRGGRLAMLLLRQQFIDLAIGPYRAVARCVARLDLLAQQFLGLGDHLAQGLARARVRSAPRIADPLHGVGSCKIIGGGRGAGLPVGLAIDFKQGTAGLLDLVLMLVETLGKARASLQQGIIFAAPDREIVRR